MTEYQYHAELVSVEKTEESVHLQLRIPENLFYFQGHFDGAPVVPGVVLTHWVVEYIEKYFEKDVTAFKALNTLKFQIIVRPNYLLDLKLSRISDQKFAFNYSSIHGQHSSGKVLFE